MFSLQEKKHLVQEKKKISPRIKKKKFSQANKIQFSKKKNFQSKEKICFSPKKNKFLSKKKFSLQKKFI